MRQIYKRSMDGAIVCGECIDMAELLTAAELSQRFFPGTWHQLTCVECGYAPPLEAPLRPAVPPVGTE